MAQLARKNQWASPDMEIFGPILDSMPESWGSLLIYLPIGVLGAFRWVSWLFRKFVAMQYHPHTGHYDATMAVTTPVYQEDPQIFELAISSWLRNPTVDEVICVIDVTDFQCQEIAAQFARARFPVRTVITDVPGKRDALRLGWEATDAEIVALVDSDTIWASDAGREILRPFSDPAIGAVATRQSVWKPTTTWQYLTDFYLDYRYFDELAGQTAWGQAVSCVSGRTAVYRRRILLAISEDFMNETFLGLPCNSGDDKRLTTLTLERGYRTYMQRTARVWSTFPEDGKTFYKQRLRWSRNTWRSDLRALSRGWVFRHPFLAFTLIDKSISPFTSLLAPLFFLIAAARGHLIVVGLMLLWWSLSRSLKNMPHLRRRPFDLLLMPAFVVISFTLAMVRIQALLTIRTQKWLTRDVGVVNGTLARTQSAA